MMEDALVLIDYQAFKIDGFGFLIRSGLQSDTQQD